MESDGQDLFVLAQRVGSDFDGVTLLDKGDVDYGGQLQVVLHCRYWPVPQQHSVQ